MELSTYRIIHIIGIMILFFAFGGIALGATLAKEKGTKDFPGKRRHILLHGVGLLLILISGFGQLAKLHLEGGMPAFVKIKLLLWLGLGAVLSLLLRKPKYNNLIWILLVLVGAYAAYLGIYKPG